MLSVLKLLLVAVFVVASPSAIPRVLHEKRSEVLNSRYHSHGLLAADAYLPLRIALKQSNEDRIEELLYDVSHPNSLNYGKHYTPVEVAKMFAPSEETVTAVREWLADHGISDERVRTSRSRSWLYANATVDEAQRLLETTFQVYKHADGSEHIGCDEYSLPAHMVPHVDLVAPTVNAPVKRSFDSHGSILKRSMTGSLIRTPKTSGKILDKTSLPSSLSTCDQFITPDCLRALYKIDRTPTQTHKNTFAILELTPQSFVESDLQLFFANFSPKSVGQSPILVSIDGGFVTANELTSFDINGESDLDFQYGMSLTAPQPVQLLQAGDAVEGASFNNLLDALDASFCTFEGGDDPDFDGIYPDLLPGGFKGPESCGIVKPANVISVSYGSDEVLFTTFYQVRECIEHAKLGLMGTTVLYASGDNGVAGGDGVCIEKLPNGTLTETLNGTIFSPSFPEGCPFVVGVGATMIDANNTVNDPESAANVPEVEFSSGGGFSNVFAVPEYQKATIAEFYKNFPPPYGADIYNNSQKVRGYPDVSANGAFFVIALDGEFELVLGTSASTPTFSSVLTLINDARLEAGKSSVGFIQPAIYSEAFKGAFNDITSGNNPGCGTEGFSAVPGWDPVTGLGTPNFPKLLEAFLALP